MQDNKISGQGLPKTNALAYFALPSVTKRNSLILYQPDLLQIGIDGEAVEILVESFINVNRVRNEDGALQPSSLSISLSIYNQSINLSIFLSICLSVCPYVLTQS